MKYSIPLSRFSCSNLLMISTTDEFTVEPDHMENSRETEKWLDIAGSLYLNVY